MTAKSSFSSSLRRAAAITFGGLALLSACAPGPDQQRASAAVGRSSSALTSSGGGFRILSDRDPSYGLNAYGGAHDGGPVQLWQGCGRDNPDCRWSYRAGMLLSASDPSLAVRGGGDWEGLTLSATCTTADPACLWTWTKGKLVNDATGYGINAYGSPHQPNPSPLVSTSACADGETNPDCTWTLESVVLASGADPRLQLYAGDSPAHTAPVTLHRDCPETDSRCTWTFKQGRVLSDYNSDLAINAWGGAWIGGVLRLAAGCGPDNLDCLWRLTTTTGGGFTGSNVMSENLGSGNHLVMLPSSGALADSGVNLVATDGGSPECRAGYLGNPACAFEAGPVTVSYSGAPARAEWTLVYFLFGETSFAWDSVDQLNRFGTAGSTDNVNIIAVLDTPTDYTPASRLGPAYSGHGVVLRINRNADPTVISDLGEIDMGDPAALGELGASVLSAFPANRYGVAMYDHGGGWYGFGYDAESNKGITIATGATDGGRYGGAYGQVLAAMDNRISAEGLGTDGRLDVVVLNACLMGEWEVAAATAPYARYLVASEQEVYGDPWGYTSFLPQLLAQPTMSGQDLGAAMVNTYYPGAPTSATLSTVDLSPFTFGDLNGAINGMGQAMQDPRLFDCIEAARLSSIGFADSSGDLRDLYDLAAKLQATTSTGGACPNATLNQAAGMVMQATSAVVVSRTSAGVPGAPGGLSIFMPRKCSRLDPNYYQGTGSVWTQTQWDEFLRAYAPPSADLTGDGAPYPATGLTGLQTSGGMLSLSWVPSPTRGVTYSLLRGTSPGSYSEVRATGITESVYLDSATPGTTYYYVVRADLCGAGTNSSEASITVSSGGPCANLCSPAIVKTGPSIQSGNLGTRAICHETTSDLTGGNCSNMTGRTLSVNGTTMSCNGWSLPAKRNNGYCIRVTKGGLSYASYSTW